MQLPQGAESLLANLTPQQVGQIQKQIEVVVERLMKDKAEWLIGEVIKATPPFAKANNVTSGGKPAGIAMAREYIRRDVEKIFSTVRSVPFRQLVANRDWEAMAAYNLKFTNPNLENAFMNKNIWTLDAAFQHKFTALANTDMYIKQQEMERIHRQYRKNGKLVPPTSQRFLVKDKNTIKDYARGVYDSIGKMVSGWFIAAKSINITSFRNPFSGQGNGSAVWNKKGEFSLTITNGYGNFNKILENNIDCQKLVETATAQLENEIEQEINIIINNLMQTGQTMPQRNFPLAKPASVAKAGGGAKGGKKP